MKDYTRKLLDKALDAIGAAEGLMDMGKAEFIHNSFRLDGMC